MDSISGVLEVNEFNIRFFLRDITNYFSKIIQFYGYRGRKGMPQIVIFIIVFCSFPARAWTPFGPNNYDDCVLANIKGAQNPQAAFAIKSACRSKFPLSDAESCEEFNNMSGLTFSEVRQVKGYEEASDDEIISHGQSIGVHVNRLLVEKRCNDSRKIKK